MINYCKSVSDIFLCLELSLSKLMVSICPSHLNTDLISSIPPEKMSLMDLQCHFHQSSIQKINSHFPIHWHLGSMNQLRMINRHPSLQVCLGSSSQFCGFQRKEFPPQCVHPNCFPRSAPWPSIRCLNSHGNFVVDLLGFFSKMITNRWLFVFTSWAIQGCI